ncbi:MAG: tripartite tricarboxylate transporter substrate binding protein [Proteobacteria bacterium]|nr:tripartite tricarboxylate transporter substrate binding protein [Pseudomonadota bacterium]
MQTLRLPALVVLALFLAAEARAQTYPAQTIRVIVPFGAGSATDIVPRIVLDAAAKDLGQPIVVENRPGAGGTTGASAVAKAEPDGYTLLATSSAHTITPSVYAKLSYDAAADFAGVVAFGELPSVLITAPGKGLTNVRDFVAAARAKSDGFNFASVGVGSATHLMAERFRLSAGFNAVHIPFRGGPEALTEVIAGRVDFYVCPVNTALPFIREGKLVALAVNAPKRVAALPEVPTTLEAGFANSDYTVWIGMFAPARTPRAIIERLHQASVAAINTPAVRDKLVKTGLDPVAMTPQAFDARVRAEIAAVGAIAKAVGIKPN